MEIVIRWNTRYQDVSIRDGGNIINLGLQNERERKELAQKFISAAQELLDGLDDGLVDLEHIESTPCSSPV